MARRRSPHDAALALVRWARERVPLYRELYADLPPVETWAAFQQLPVLTTARLRSTPLVEQVDAPEDVLRSQTAYALQSAVTPRTLVLDADDTDAAFDQTRAGFALAGCRAGMRVALVAHPQQRYVAAEIADQLGYFRVTADLVIAIDAATVARTIEALAPQRIVVFGVCASGDGGEPVTVRRPGSNGADLYIVPEAGIVAVRPGGETAYRVLRRYCLLEQDEGDGGLLLTLLLRYHQPLIRYQLPDRGLLARGRLWLEEVAP
jgi:phenylacetate-coenzyme A ligase PaaK-like adenylate-forming protein